LKGNLTKLDLLILVVTPMMTLFPFYFIHFNDSSYEISSMDSISGRILNFECSTATRASGSNSILVVEGYPDRKFSVRDELVEEQPACMRIEGLLSITDQGNLLVFKNSNRISKLKIGNAILYNVEDFKSGDTTYFYLVFLLSIYFWYDSVKIVQKCGWLK